jgi:hypothetical protein
MVASRKSVAQEELRQRVAELLTVAQPLMLKTAQLAWPQGPAQAWEPAQVRALAQVLV